MKLNSLSELTGLLPKGMRVADSVKDDSGFVRHDGRGQIVSISLDTKGRKGKVVTMIGGLRHNPDTLKEIASALKQFCGAGGSVKNGVIEIQGDQRTRVADKMRRMGYNVSP
jgi:translation initiation factor 1